MYAVDKVKVVRKILVLVGDFRNVCVVLALNRFFSPSISASSARSVRAEASILERYKLCGHPNHDTEMVHLRCNAVSRVVDNAMPCHRIGYGRRDIHIRAIHTR